MSDNAKFNLANPIHFLALGFGTGLAPKAPGTFGTLATLPFLYFMMPLSVAVYIAVTVVLAIVGIYLCGKTAKDSGVHDHGAIVWDEIVGYLITMIGVAFSWQSLLVGFLLFRFFDILKPWPISYIDKHVHGGLGIMLDDVAAGLAALVCMHFIFYFLRRSINLK